MSAIDYLSEDGSGVYRRWHVPDLVPSSRAGELVFVFESPHVDELRARLPVVGSAGRSALRFLLPGQPKDQSLGRFVQQRHADGDDRIALLNVSNVPMQKAAFVGSEAPDLGDEVWTLIEKVRRSSARSLGSMRGTETAETAEALARGLRRRLSGDALGPECRVVAAGTFAQRMVAATLPELTPSPLRVPHPSFGQWNRMANQNLADLVSAKESFIDCSTPAACGPAEKSRA